MGEEYLCANVTKREYLYPGDLALSSKQPSVCTGSTAAAVALLMVKGLDFHPMCGHWAGDEVLVTGDTTHFHSATDKSPDPGCIALYEEAMNYFRSIAVECIAMLSDHDFRYAELIVCDAMDNKRTFAMLFDIHRQGRIQNLDFWLNECMGPDWHNWHKRQRRR